MPVLTHQDGVPTHATHKNFVAAQKLSLSFSSFLLRAAGMI
jgi:hypothetical protein